jgi:hypothetical protein
MSRRAAATKREIDNAIAVVQQRGLTVTGVKIDGTQILVLTDKGAVSSSREKTSDLDRELAEFEASHGQN